MKFTMSRDRTVSTLFGRSFDFEKGVPLHVPDICWGAVVEAGAVPEEDLPDDSNADPSVLQGAERSAAILAAIKAMVLKNDRNDFTAAGSPNASILSAAVGFPVDAKERDAAWAAAQNDAG